MGTLKKYLMVLEKSIWRRKLADKLSNFVTLMILAILDRGNAESRMVGFLTS